MTAARQEKLDELRKQIAQFPREPGVYLFKDKSEVVLYVGKAKSLRNRVASYFQPGANLLESRGPEIDRMISKLVMEISIIQCDSEVDALLVENRLIKDIQPRFNTRQTDGKSFPYLQIVTSEDFPRVETTRNPRSKGVKLYGPFIHSYELRQSLPMLQRVFKFRTCKLDVSDTDDKRRYFRPCILYNIKQCTAPCADRVSKQDYADQIKRFRQFLESKGTLLKRELTDAMKKASAELDFEKAAELRDELRALESLQKRGLADQEVQPEVFYVDPTEGLERLAKVLDLPSVPRTIEGIDIAHLQGTDSCGSVVCFIDGKPFKNQYRRFKIKTVLGNDDFASIREVVSRRYRDAGQNEELYPDIILIDGGKGQLHAAAEIFEHLQCKPPMLLSLAKKEELVFTLDRDEPIKMSRRNPALRLLQSVRDEAHRFVQAYHHLLREKTTLRSRKKNRRS